MTIRDAIRSFVAKSVGLDRVTAILRRQRAGEAAAGPREKYKHVDIVFACVEKIINNIAGLPLMLSTTDDKIIESGDLFDLLFNNPAYPWQQFVQDWVGHWALTRDVFVVFSADTGLDQVSFEVVSGLQMHAITDDGTPAGNLVGWEYRGLYGQRQRLSLAQVHQTKNYNPYDRFHGLGPLTPAENAANVSHAVTERAHAILRNGAEPGLILTLPPGAASLTPEEREYFAGVLDSRHAGSAQAGRTAVLGGGMDVKTIAQSMVDLQAAELGEKADCKIAVAFGVPPQLVGLKSEAQYSHGPAQRDFVFGTVASVGSLMADMITAAFGSRGYAEDRRGVPWTQSQMHSGRCADAPRCKAAWRAARQKAARTRRPVFAWFDLDQHPVVQEAKREWAKEMLSLTQYGIPAARIIDAYDLPFDHSDLPWLHEWWLEPSRMPARWILDGGPDVLLGPPLAEGDAGADAPEKGLRREGHKEKIDKTIVEKSRRIWRNYINSWQPIELKFRSALRTYFRRQKNDLIKQLEAALADHKTEVRGQKTEDRRLKTEDVIARVVFDLRIENGKLKAIHKTFFERAAQLGAAQIAADVGGLAGKAAKATVEQVIRRAAMRKALTASAIKIQRINKTTRQRVAATLRQGLADGEGLPQLRKRLEREASFTTDRAQRIARAHTGSAVSAGRHEAAKHLGAELKFWLTSGDEAVRKSHKDAQRDHAEGIPLDEAFKVGGDFLMYPGDPGGSAANVVNCRCMELVKRIGGKTYDLDHYDRARMFGADDLELLLTAH